MTQFAKKIKPSVRWCQDLNGTFIFEEIGKQTRRLSMPKSVIWNILLLFPRDEMTLKMIASILGISQNEARHQIQECMTEWKELGLLE